MSYLSLANVALSYGSGAGLTPALADINLELGQGDICALVGPSGVGKSTLVSILSGSLTHYSGSIRLDGQDLDSRMMQIALVPQHYGLLPWKTIEENIHLPQALGRRSLEAQELEHIVDSLGLGTLLRRYPHELSGGQRQRVALARAFGVKPDLLLLDEAFSALDIVTATRSRQLFLELWRRYPCTTIIITHNPAEAVALASKILILSGTPGRIKQRLELPSEELLRQYLSEAYDDAVE